MKLNYKNQLILMVVIVILFNILSDLLDHWIYRNIGFWICGILWILHPVLPQNTVHNKKNLNIVRIAGIILILIGTFTRVNPN